jgi:hypothetical protein
VNGPTVQVGNPLGGTQPSHSYAAPAPRAANSVAGPTPLVLLALAVGGLALVTQASALTLPLIKVPPNVSLSGGGGPVDRGRFPRAGFVPARWEAVEEPCSALQVAVHFAGGGVGMGDVMDPQFWLS